MWKDVSMWQSDRQDGRKMARSLALLAICLVTLATSSGFLLHKKLCYDPVGCFETSYPFSNSYGETPDSPEDIQIRIYLWTKENPVAAHTLDYQDPETINGSNFDPRRPTKILIHGFMTNGNKSAAVANLSVAFLKKNNYNIIGIDWSRGAKQFYPKAVANTRVVGAVLSKLVQILQQKFSLKLSDLHIIGHSLGAHIAGYIGQRVPGISRITGLDPAGPMFTKTDPLVRLDPTDALFVDVIHSDAAPLQDAGFGTLQALGHQDFYPNGGQTQPGCPPPIKTSLEELLTLEFSEAVESVICAHARAIWYFIESVLNDHCQFVALPCHDWTAFKNGSCTACGASSCPTMGIDSIKSPARGSFYLKTAAQSPFCIGTAEQESVAYRSMQR